MRAPLGTLATLALLVSAAAALGPPCAGGATEDACLAIPNLVSIGSAAYAASGDTAALASGAGTTGGLYLAQQAIPFAGATTQVDVQFDLFMGGDQTAAPADGVAVWLADTNTFSASSLAGSFGYGSLAGGLVVAAIDTAGTWSGSASSSLVLRGAAPATANLAAYDLSPATLRGAWYHARVTFAPSGTAGVVVSFQYAAENSDAWTTVVSGLVVTPASALPAAVTVGISASTGASAYEEHAVRNVRVHLRNTALAAGSCGWCGHCADSAAACAAEASELAAVKALWPVDNAACAVSSFATLADLCSAGCADVTCSNSHVTGLVLRGKTVVVGEVLGQLPHLSSLAIESFHFAEFPAAFSTLPELRSLTVDSHSLFALPAQLPSTLLSLEVRNARIQSLTPACSAPSLASLVAVDNEFISVLPSCLASLGALATLSVTGSPIRDVEFYASSLNSLKTLRIAGGFLRDLSVSSSSLETLDLSGNYIPGSALAIESLPSLRTLVLSNNGMTELVLGQLGSLQSLDISNNRIESLTLTSVSLPSLLNLDVSGNEADSCMATAALFPNLQQLDCSDNEVVDMSALCALSALRSLDVSSNAIRFLECPSGSSYFTHLQSLDASRNPLEAFPTDVYVSASATLQRLALAHTSIDSLPAPIAAPQLAYLDVSGNPLGELPSITSPLQTLLASSASIGTLPSSVLALTTLRTLAIADNGFTEIPAALCASAALVSLDVSDNSLYELPLSCASLRFLNASANYLTEPPAALLAVLETADLSDNLLQQWPLALAPLPSQLRALFLGRNLLSTLPDAFFAASALTQLALDHNRIAALPATLAQAASLQELDVSHNLLSAVPDLSQLLSLRSLDVSHTYLRALPAVPASLRALTAASTLLTSLAIDAAATGLASLDVSGAPVLSLSIAASAQSSLRSLVLAGVALSADQMEQVCGITSLAELDVSATYISALPQSCERLLHLRSLSLARNPGVRSLPDLRSGVADPRERMQLQRVDVSSCSLTNDADIAALGATEVVAESNALTSVAALLTSGASSLKLASNLLGYPTLPKNLTIKPCTVCNQTFNYSTMPQNVTLTAIGRRAVHRQPSPGALGHIELLDLSNNAVTSFGGDDISALLEIESLNLAGNPLKTVKVPLGARKLNVSGTGVKRITMPVSVHRGTAQTTAHSVGLRSLDLSGLNLQTLDCGFINAHIKELVLDDNKLSTLPECFADATKLKSLSVKNNKLSSLPESLQAQATREGLQGGVSLKNLALDGNSFTEVDDVVGLKYVEVLSMSSNRISYADPIFNEMALLVDVDLSRNLLGSVDTISWKRGPQRVSTLKRLNANSNPLSSITLASSTEHLDAGNTSMSAEAAGIFSSRVARITYPSLTGVTIHPCTVCNQTFNYSTMPQNVTLTAITRRGNARDEARALGPLRSASLWWRLEDIDVSSSFLSTLPDLSSFVSLRKFKASGNAITDISPVLSAPPTLTSLSVAGNKITSLPDLSSLQGLVDLDVSGNALTSLPQLPSALLHLDASSNALTSLQASALPATLETLAASGNKLSSLPAGVASLQALRTLDVSDNDLTAVPQLGASLRELSAADNYLSSVEGLSSATRLEALDIAKNKLNDIPGAVASMPHLHTLVASSNNILAIPDSVASLPGLRHLDVSGNKLTAVPQGLLSTAHMEELHAASNYISQIPNGINALLGLRKLNLAGNLIASVPETLAHLGKLAELNLSANRLASFALAGSTADWPLASVRVADLAGNLLRELDEDTLAQLARLEFLDVSGNGLSALPDVFGGLSRISELRATNNALAALPESLADLRWLSALDVSGNVLTGLPAAFCESNAALTRLNVASNRLQRLCEGGVSPAFVLRELDVSNNRLTTLADVAGMVSLAHLNASGNAIADLGQSLFALSRLVTLDLGYNALTSFPASFFAPRLTRALLHGNKLASVPLSAEMAPRLQELSLHSNALPEIPSGIMSLGASLTSLSLSHNRIASVPASIARLANLASLELANNSLHDSASGDARALPAELFTLRRLASLKLQNNKIKYLPDNIGSLAALRELHLGDEIVYVPASMSALSPYLSVCNIRGSCLDCSAVSFCACTVDAERCPCNATECLASWRGDGVCDPSCNVASCGYDDGDCSSAGAQQSCVRPTSHWMDIAAHPWPAELDASAPWYSAARVTYLSWYGMLNLGVAQRLPSQLSRRATCGVYCTLAHQYIAARLNIAALAASETAVPADALGYVAAAASIFETADVTASSWPTNTAASMALLADHLSSFNEGSLGVAACSA